LFNFERVSLSPFNATLLLTCFFLFVLLCFDAKSGGYNQGAALPGTSDKPRVQHTSLVPVTLKQIQMASQDPNEDKLLIDGREVTQVRVVGQVQEMTTSANGNNFTFHLDDGTASTEVRLFISETPPNGGIDYHMLTKDSWRQGTYMEVYGTIKVLSPKENKRSIMAQRVNVVTDFNLITHHFLQCIHTHLFATKGGNLGNHVQQITGGIQRFDPYSAMHHGGAAAAAPNPYNNSMASSAPAPAATGLLVNPLHASIHAVFKLDHPKGFTIEYVASQLPQYSPDVIKTAVEELLGADDIYTTVLNHYKA
jgi:hypothetical protein